MTFHRLINVFALVPIVCGAIAAGNAPSAARAADDRPNIVFILLDDMDVFSPMWKAMPFAKEHIRDRGLTFIEAFAPTPICCPARVSILTGLYGHNTGVLTLSGKFGGVQAVAEPLDQNGQRQTDASGRPISNEQRTFAKTLKAAGYETVMIGKYVGAHDHRPGFVPQGWTEWHQLGGRSMYTGLGFSISHWREGMSAPRVVNDYGSAYSTDVLGEMAAAFVERNAKAKNEPPFFMWLAPTAPHLPIKPAARHKYDSIFPWQRVDRWRDEHGDEPYFNLVRRPSYNESDVSDKPTWLSRDQSEETRSRAVGYADQEYQDRMGSLYAVDEMIAKLYHRLEAAGELENTVFVITSDNGYNLGAHRLIHKMAPYEESLRIPMVLSGPGVRTGTSSAPTLLIDLAPTFLELAGLKAPSEMDGFSLRPILEQDYVPSDWREDFIAQYLGGFVRPGYAPPKSSAMHAGYKLDLPSYRALRNDRYTYVEWLPAGQYPYHDKEKPFEPELYDRLSDPYQMRNLLKPGHAATSEHLELAASLRERLWELAECRGATCRSKPQH